MLKCAQKPAVRRVLVKFNYCHTPASNWQKVLFVVIECGM